MALQSPEMRELYDLKVFVVSRLLVDKTQLTLRTAIPTSCWRGGSNVMSQNEEEMLLVFWTRRVCSRVALMTSTCVSSRTAMIILFNPPRNSPTSSVSRLPFFGVC